MNYITKSFTYDGVRYWVRGKTEEEATEKAIRRKVELEEGKSKRLSTALVNDWFGEYMLAYKQNISAKAKKDYESIYRLNIKPYIGAMPIKNVKALDCQKIINGMQGMSASYIHKTDILMKAMLEAAVDNDMIPKNPARKIAVPKGEKGSRRALSPKEREVFLKASQNGSKWDLFCRIIYYCGLRPSEVARIRGGDYENGVLHVRGTKTESAERDVPIPSALILPKLKKGQMMFCTSTGREIDKSVFQRYWKAIKRQMNIVMGAKMYRNRLEENLVAPDLTLYCLRHDYCTRLQEAGVPIDVARRLMGHSSIEVTSKIYTHANQASFENARDLIESHNKK